MPVANCLIFGCGSCRRRKGSSLWQKTRLVSGTRRDERLGEIKKDKRTGSELQGTVEEQYRINTCEEHFKLEDISSTNYAFTNRPPAGSRQR